mmetsp:Transcript_17443/g.37695  ORF Transcript_17443/g.37695 Transcript_17443/m.37695 type:complete len:94 (-) Transcript_17443:147-428(-)
MSPDLGFRDKDVDESSTMLEATEEDSGISGVTPHSPSALARKSEEDECREPMFARRLPMLGLALLLAVVDHALAARKRWLQRKKAVAGSNILS